MDNNKPKLLDTVYVIILDILKDIIPIFCIALSASMLSSVFSSMFYSPVYTSRCTMIVSAKVNNSGVYTDTTETERLTDTIDAVMTSTVLKKKTAQSLGLEKFDGKVNLNVITNTNMIEMSVTSSSPNIAFRQLNAMLDIYPEISKEILGKIVMEVFEEPNFPSFPSNPANTTKIRRLSFLIAAAFTVLLVVLYSYYRDTVKSKWEVNEKLDTRLLGVLNHETRYHSLKAFITRNKKRLLVGSPGVSFAFNETIKKLRTNLSYFQEKTDGKVLLVTSYKAKEGKTTIAANLAYAMAQRKQKVLVISGNYDSTDLLNVLNINLPRKFTSGRKTSYADLIYTKPDSTLSILTGVAAKSKNDFSRRIISENFGIFIQRAKEMFDFIIIDGPCSKDNANAEIFAKIADFSLLTVKQNWSKSTHINDVIDMLNGYNSGLIGCVFNNVFSSATVINASYGYGYGYHYGYKAYGKYGSYSKYNAYHHYNAYNHYVPEINNVKHQAKRYKK